MDSMSVDLMPSLAVTYFDKEVLFERVRSGDIDSAESYLSAFTKKDSNFHSNLMFYYLARQKAVMTLMDRNKYVDVVVFFYDWLERDKIPETIDFITKDIDRCKCLAYECFNLYSGKETTIDVASVAKCLMDEMPEMMNNLVALNPDLQKDISLGMETLRL